MEETREKRSGDAGSNHHLVLAEIEMKLLALEKEISSRSKYCTYKLKDQMVKDEFVIALANRYDVLYNRSDDGEEQSLTWNRSGARLRQYILLPARKSSLRSEENEKTWKLVKERCKLKARMEAAKSRNQKLASALVYNLKNREVKRSCRRDKRKRIDDIV